jgi:hypothetical protein
MIMAKQKKKNKGPEYRNHKFAANAPQGKSGMKHEAQEQKGILSSLVHGVKKLVRQDS